MFTELLFFRTAFLNQVIRFLVCLTCLSSTASGQDASPKTDRRPESEKNSQLQATAIPLVFGTVETRNGQPVSNAKVWLVGGSQGTPEVLSATISDDQGRFAFSDFADEETMFQTRGTLCVWARHPSEGLGWLTGVYNHKRKPLSLQIAPTTKFAGQVVGPDGQPLGGVKIIPRSLSGARLNQRGERSATISNEASQEFSTTTTDEGKFEIEGLPFDGAITSELMLPGFHELRVSWNLNTPVVIKLDQGGPFSGRVTWPVNIPIPTGEDFKFGTVKLIGNMQFQADGTVSPDGKNAVYGTESSYTVTIDGEGKFQLDHIAPGRYFASSEFSSGLPLLLSGPGKFDITPGKVNPDFELVAEQAFKISGRVVGFENKNPIGNVSVQILRRVPGGLIPFSQVNSNENGEYFVFTKKGKHTVRAVNAPPAYIPSADSYDSEFSNSRIPTIDVTEDTVCPDIELDPACDVTFEVFDEYGKPASGAIVRIVAAAGYPAGSDYQTEQRTDSEGKYVARRVTANDTLPIYVRTPTAISKLNLVVTPQNLNGPLRIDLSPDHGFQCRFFVADRDGEPIANANVSLETYFNYVSKWIEAERGLGISGSAGEGVTDADGYFQSGPLWPGRAYRLTVKADGYDQSETPRVTGKAGEVVEMQPIVLATAKPAKIVGVIVDSNNRPIENVRVFAAGKSHLVSTDLTDELGQFELNDLASDVRYVFADGGVSYRLGGARVGNQQPLEIAIRSVDSPPQGIRSVRTLPRDEQLATAKDLIEQFWSLPKNVQVSSQYDLLLATVQVDSSRAMLQAQAVGRNEESFVLAELASRIIEDDPDRAIQYLATIKNRLGTATAIELGMKLATSDKEGDNQTANRLADLAQKSKGRDTRLDSRLAILFSALGQHDDAQALIEEILKPIDLDKPTEEQKLALIQLAPAIAPYDFEKARSLASLAVEGHTRTSALADVAVAIVKNDPEKAIHEIQSLTGDSNAPSIRDRSRLRAALLLVATHPDIAIKLAYQCEEACNRAQSLGRLAVHVAEFNQTESWKMIEAALAIHRDRPDAFRSWSNYGGAGPFAAALAYHAQQVNYPDMESVIWHVRMACRANGDQGQQRLSATVKTARVLALVDQLAARELLNAIAHQTGQLARDEGNDSLYDQWLQAWLLVDFGQGVKLLKDELERFKKSDENEPNKFGHGRVFRLLVSPQPECYPLLLRETGLWKLEEDGTMKF